MTALYSMNTPFSGKRLALNAFILLAQCALLCRSEETVRTVVVHPNEITYVEVMPKQKTRFQLSSSRHDVSFIVFQVHSYRHPVILSLTKHPTETTSVAGRDVGVVTIPEQTSEVDWYVLVPGKHCSNSFRVLVLASLYNKGVPVPGGCNMEFALEIDPNLHLSFEHTVNLIEFQYAHKAGSVSSSCDVQLQLSLEYTIYQLYVDSGENGTFQGLEKMLNAEVTRKYGKKMHTFSAVDKTEQRFAAFMNKGIVYNIMVTEQHRSGGNISAMYIPITSYGCHGNKIHCTYMDSYHAFALTTVALLGLVGIFLCFFGHHFFKTEMFVFGFLGLFIVSCVLLGRYTGLSLSMMVLVAIIVGITGGVLWLLLWYYKGIPVISVLCVGFTGGYLIASIIFNLTPLGGWHWWHVPLNYGLAFASAVLVLPALLLAFTKTLNIVCCALVGSYLVVFAIDVFVQGNVSQIVLLSIRKSVWNDMLKAIVSIPYQWSDFILFTLWILLAVGGAIVQFFRERHRAPFPPCPRQQQQLQLPQSGLRQPAVVVQPTAPPVNGHSYDADVEEDDENEPLLQAFRQMEYQTNKRHSYQGKGTP